MPIEILELVIKATVSEPEPTAANNRNAGTDTANAAALEPVEKAVKEIMDILKRKNER